MSAIGRKILAFAHKVGDLPDRPSPTFSAAEIKAQLDSSPEELRLSLNGLIDDLTSSSPGASGSDQVGAAPIGGLSGTTVYTQLLAIKALLDGATNQNAFSAVAVPGQSTVIADAIADTLTLVGGTGIAITTVPGTDTVTFTATGVSVPGAHASSHVTGGTDVIPSAVANGNAGLFTGADKARLDSIYANGGLPVSTNGRVSNVLIATTAATNLTVYAVGSSYANFLIPIYYTVAAGTTNVTVQVTYSDAAGAQTNTILNAQSSPIGSYSLIPLFINAAAGTNIIVKITASVANRVSASCTILGV